MEKSDLPNIFLRILLILFFSNDRTEEELKQYDRMEKINMDMRAREAFIIEQAKAEGKEEGIHLVAKNLKDSGLMSHEQIAAMTKLSLDQIDDL